MIRTTSTKNSAVIEKTGHEVWTIFETGTYDTQAMHILVNFIDNVKSLQFTSYDVEMIAHATENWSKTSSTDLNLTSVHSPHEISHANIMRVEVTLTYNVQHTTATEIIAFNPQRSKIESAAELILAGSGGRTVNLYLLPPENSSEISLEIIALRKTDENWHTSSETSSHQSENNGYGLVSQLYRLFLTCPSCSMELNSEPQETVFSV